MIHRSQRAPSRTNIFYSLTFTASSSMSPMASPQWPLLPALQLQHWRQRWR